MHKTRAPWGLYGAAFAAFALGGALCGVFVIRGVSEVNALGDAPVLEVPGEYFVEAKVPGTYDLLHVVDEDQPLSASLPERLSLRLARPDDEGGVEGRWSEDLDAWTYTVNGRAMTPLATFAVNEPGRYRLVVSATDEAPVHARVVFGHGFIEAVGRAFRGILWAVLAGVAAFLVAMPLFVVGLLLHLKRARRA